MVWQYCYRVTLDKLFKADSQVSNQNGNVCRTILCISRQTDKLSYLTLNHSIFTTQHFFKCCLCVQNYEDKHLHSTKQREIMAFNPNMHKKRFCPRQNNTPLAGTLEKLLSFPFSSYHSSSSSVQFHSFSDDHPCQESSVLSYRKASLLFSLHQHLHKLISSFENKSLFRICLTSSSTKKTFSTFIFTTSESCSQLHVELPHPSFLQETATGC